MPGSEQIDGSSHNESCANIYSEETANILSTSKLISKTHQPVPIFLVPKVIAADISEFSDTLMEIHIKRSKGHNYLIRTFATAKAGEEKGDDS